ncbi:MAG: nickel pincer cofactor biosynthesis protein LarC [Candidatus Helarchaeota archaeon]
MNVVIIDGSISGISGDMVIAALIDLGGNKEKIYELRDYLVANFDDLRSMDIEIKKVVRGGIYSTYINLKMDEINTYKSSKELMNTIKKVLMGIKATKEETELALKIMTRLIEVESKIHGKNISDVHLHELSSFDTILDIIGTTILCKDLGLLENTEWLGLPLAVGGGKVSFSHGIYSVPAPATMEILKNANYKIVGSTANCELATPTGVAILTTLVKKQINSISEMKVKKIGYGAGSKEIPGVCNVVRFIIGERLIDDLDWEEISVLETNIDDVTGEIIGNIITEMMESGNIKDINVIPTITKKNRPGYIIKVISDIQNENNNIKYLMRETGTLGVRVYRIRRKILKREIVHKLVRIKDKDFNIPFKVSWADTEVINFKPEFNDVKRISKELKLPIQKIIKIIYNEINENDFI